MIPDKALSRLRKIFGKDLHTDPARLLSHSYDATQKIYLPDAVAFPSSAQQVSQALELANRHRFPVIPRGSGTGFSGGSLPVRGGLVLSFSKMNRILEIDPVDMVAVVEPGVLTAELQREVEKRGLFYPPDPASHKVSTIGGNIAENAGGPRCLKYGVTRNYVLGLEVVLPDGTLLELGGRTIKNVAGYDLTFLVVGSEGTLAVITKAILKLIPKPRARASLRADFKGAEDACQAANAVLSAGLLPSAMEFMDEHSLKAVVQYTGESLPSEVKASLLVEVDGTEEAVAEQLSEVEEVLLQHRPVSVERASSEEEEEKVWRLRRSLSPAIATLKPIKVNEDIVVPRSRLLEALDFTYRMGEKMGALAVIFGHIGDGNLHVNFMVDREGLSRVEGLLEEYFRGIVELGGSITGEHGVGITKKNFLPLQLQPPSLELMRKVKKLLDPSGVLNPGKIF